MPRKLMNALTSLFVKNAKPGRHADGGGLYLLVKTSGARSWVFRATAAGKVRDVGLGSAGGSGAISLSEARERARIKASEVSSGEIPVSDRRRRTRDAKAVEQAARVSKTTFEAMANAYIGLHEDSWHNSKHRAQWRSTLEKYVYPHFGRVAVADIETAHVMAALQPIWKEKPETAGRVRGRIETVLDAAKVQGLREGENPARWRGHLDHLLPRRDLLSRGHHAAVPYSIMPGFMAALRDNKSTGALALEFTILCAVRSGTTLGAIWGEFDLSARLWTIPAGKMKSRREHRVPLPNRAVAILEQMKPENTDDLSNLLVFRSSNGNCLSSMTMAMTLRRLGRNETVHGFRSTFRDWAAECTNFPHELSEMALAHIVANKVEAAYRRGDMLLKRRELMEEWSSYCNNGSADKNRGDK